MAHTHSFPNASCSLDVASRCPPQSPVNSGQGPRAIVEVTEAFGREVASLRPHSWKMVDQGSHPLWCDSRDAGSGRKMVSRLSGATVGSRG